MKPGCRASVIVIAYALSMVLTVLGFQHTFLYKVPDLWNVALWFPVVYVPVLRGDTILMLLTASLQFPLLATAFAFGIRRFRPLPVALMLIGVYAICAGAAVAYLSSKSP